MFVLAFLILLVPAAVAAVLVRLILTLTGTDRARPRTPEAQRASRSSAIAIGVSSLLAVMAALYLISTDRWGRGYLLAGPVSMVILQLGLAATTLIISTAIRSQGQVRVAGLSPRRVSDNAPRSLTVATAMGVLAALVLAAIASAVASIDDATGVYRAFMSPGEYGGVDIRTPFAGSFYSLPLMITLLVSAVVATTTLIGAHRWGALNQPDVDLTLRLGISTRTVAATAMSTGLTLTIVCWSLSFAAFQVAGSADDSTAWSIGRFAFPAAGILGFVLGAWAFTAFLFPTVRRRVRR